MTRRMRMGAGARAGTALGAIVGAFAIVEFTSGILQGYYTPLMTDIARHLGVNDADVNWLEGAQLMLAAITVPVLSRLGDAIGHKRILLISTAITALASFALVVAPSFPVFLAAWALQGFYTVWLPLEIALIWIRAERAAAEPASAQPTPASGPPASAHPASAQPAPPAPASAPASAPPASAPARLRPAQYTRKAAGLLVAALQLGAIGGALSGGALIDALPLPIVLLVPAVAVALCLVAIALWVEETPNPSGGRLDAVGTALLTLALLGVTGGLSLLRLEGPASVLPWIAIAAGLALLWPFARWELRRENPLIDVRMFANPALWPVFLTSALFGVSVLGAQAPLSTFARTDPAVTGYGLGTSGFQTSLIIGAYVLSLVVGALLFPVVTRVLSPRLTLMGATLLVAIGYGLFVPLHESYSQVLSNMLVAGLGSGALVAALPSAAAAAAPARSTGVATGLTNGTRTIGGAVASCVFGLALATGVAAATGADAGGAAETAGSLSGYMTVWIVCSVTALVAAGCLLVVPRNAFADAPGPDAALQPGV